MPRPASTITGRWKAVIEVARGQARMRRSERLCARRKPAPAPSSWSALRACHEIDAAPDEALDCVPARTDHEALNITEIHPLERSEAVYRVDPIHRHHERGLGPLADLVVFSTLHR